MYMCALSFLEASLIKNGGQAAAVSFGGVVQLICASDVWSRCVPSRAARNKGIGDPGLPAAGVLQWQR